MRALRDVVLLGAIGTLIACDSGNEAPKKALSGRVMASKGFIPPGAPLKPPPRPAPRDGAVPVDFPMLADFEFEVEGGALPDEVAALDGRKVEVIGVMYFAVADPANVKEFFLMPDHAVCCFGTPRINQIVEVLLPEGEATEYVLDYYLIRGKLQIGPFYDEHGLPLCLYRIEDAGVEFLE
ncbi:MAG: DUF3299 domain-containing protein [Planctomycetota bacterium]